MTAKSYQPRETGVLLVGHGTRDLRGRAEFLETADRMRQQLNHVVEPCFLELAKPSITTAVDRLLEQHIRLVVTCPLLLFSAEHVKRDIPRAVNAELRGRLPVAQLAHLGCDEHLLALSSLRYHELLRSIDPTETTEPIRTLLIMVGRGSRDPTATAEMLEFARRRDSTCAADSVDVCFLAMARPQLDEMLNLAGNSDFERIVVQPHLLFHGELLKHLQKKVEEAAAIFDRKTWLTASHLGCHPLLVESILRGIEHGICD